jgi:hypothetical protein
MDRMDAPAADGSSKTGGTEPALCPAGSTGGASESREGTCYKASGWTALGKTKGYSRHAADYYVKNDRPKKLWVRELRQNATELLRSIHLPAESTREELRLPHRCDSFDRRHGGFQRAQGSQGDHALRQSDDAAPAQKTCASRL